MGGWEGSGRATPSPNSASTGGSATKKLRVDAGNKTRVGERMGGEEEEEEEVEGEGSEYTVDVLAVTCMMILQDYPDEAVAGARLSPRDTALEVSWDWGMGRAWEGERCWHWVCPVTGLLYGYAASYDRIPVMTDRWVVSQRPI